MTLSLFGVPIAVIVAVVEAAIIARLLWLLGETYDQYLDVKSRWINAKRERDDARRALATIDEIRAIGAATSKKLRKSGRL
jgi:hypothetical protein